MFQKQTNKNLKSCCLQYIKEIKYLGINQLKEVYELNKKFSKIILREIKEDIYNGGIIKLKDSNFPRTIYRFRAIATKITRIIFVVVVLLE